MIVKWIIVNIKRLFLVIYPTCFAIKEPVDEWLFKAVLLLINTYKTSRLNKVT